MFLIAATTCASLAYGLRAELVGAASPNYVTADATRGSVEETVLATGILKPSKLVAVGAQASGRITALKVELGQKVEEGELLAEIDSLTQQNELRTAKANLASAKAEKAEQEANLAYAQSVLRRQARTLEMKASSRDEYDSALATVKTTLAKIDALQARIELAQVAVETAQLDLAYTKITAPTSGTVLAIVSQEGQTVNATQSAPTIVILGQVDVMTVRAEISEADVVKVAPGQKVRFAILGEPGRYYESRLESIEPAPESITSDSSFSSSSSGNSTSTEAIYYNGIFSIPNPEGRLRTYMTAEVRISLAEAKDVLTVPSSALISQSGGEAYRLQVLEADGRVVSREVEVGIDNKILAEIRSGLAEGESVVLGQSSTAAASGSSRRGPRGPMGF